MVPRGREICSSVVTRFTVSDSALPGSEVQQTARFKCPARMDFSIWSPGSFGRSWDIYKIRKTTGNDDMQSQKSHTGRQAGRNLSTVNPLIICQLNCR